MVNRRRLIASSRLNQDYIFLKRNPVPYITAEPLESDILEWHYVVKGPEDSPYNGGYYHGVLKFPVDYPFKPPAVFMLTPNGRFRTNTRLCLSISDLHPESWNPAWSVSSILTGLLSFMLESTTTLGSIETSTCQKEVYARNSLAYNLENKIFSELFPEICVEMKTTLALRKQQEVYANCVYNTNSGNSENGGMPEELFTGNWSSIFWNIGLLAGFALIAFAANLIVDAENWGLAD